MPDTPESSPLWLRGQVCMDKGRLRRMDAQPEEYSPLENALDAPAFSRSAMGNYELAFDLAALHVDFRPKTLLAFAKKHGLFWHGPAQPGGVEVPETWMPCVEKAHLILDLYNQISSPLSNSELQSNNQGREEARRRAELMLFEKEISGTRRLDSTFSYERGLIAQLLGPELKILGLWLRPVDRETTPREGEEQEQKPKVAFGRRSELGRIYVSPKRMALDVSSPTLPGFAFFQIARLLDSGQPLAKCCDCRRFFLRLNPRAQFCSELCATRTRVRRFNKKRDTQENRPEKPRE